LFQELSTSQQKAGGISQADVNDSYIQEIASFALAEIDGRSNALYRQKILKIVEAQQQVCLVLICILLVVYCSVH